MGLSHEVCDGDYIDVAIYKNYYPDTESYTKFEKYEEIWHNSWPIMLFYVILKSERKFA